MTSKIIILFSTAIIFLNISNPHAQKGSGSEPWETLFNGKDFENWKVINNKNNVFIEEGAIVCHPVANTTVSTFLCTEEKFDNFIFEADAIIEGPLHTNFIIRGSESYDDDHNGFISGYQVKIDPTERRWTGGIFDGLNGKIVWYYPLKDSERARSAFKFKEWNHYRIEAIGDSIKVWVNNIPTCNLVHDRYTKGNIAIKIHWIGDQPEMEKVLMKFKNLRIITKNPAAYKRPMNYPLKDYKNS